MTSHVGPDLRIETWIAQKLEDRTLFSGTTTAEERCNRVRRKILDAGLAQHVVGRRGGVDQTWEMIFRLTYGETLEEDLFNAASAA